MIVDIIIIVLFILMIIYGYVKGCVNIVMKLVSLILSFVAAYYLGGVVGNFIKTTDFGQRIQNVVQSSVSNGLIDTTENSVISMIQQSIGEMGGVEISNTLTNYIFMGIGFVLVFILARIAFTIIKNILENVFDLPVLRVFNRLGGVIVSAILFIIEISIILAIIKSVSALSFMARTISIIDDSLIIKTLYEHNIVTNLLMAKII